MPGWAASPPDPASTGASQPARGLPGPLPGGADAAALRALVADALADQPEGSPVVIGCSGGPDSAALLRLCAKVRPDLDLLAAHVRHGLRDDAEDQQRATAQAEAAGARLVVAPVRVRERGEGLAAAARAARLAALHRLAVDAGAAVVLLGHTAEDRAETVLLNLARGAGLDGLAATAAERVEGPVRWRRPLLAARRADVRRVAADGPPVADDPSNRDASRRRTRARFEALPALERLAPGPGDAVGALLRSADLAREDRDALEDLAASAAARSRCDWGAVRCLWLPEVAAEPTAVARRVVRALLADAGARPEARAVEEARTLAPGGARTAPGGVRVRRSGGWLCARPAALEPPGTAELPATGALCWSAGGVELVVEALGAGDRRPGAGGGARDAVGGVRDAADSPVSPPLRRPAHHERETVAGAVLLLASQAGGAVRPPRPGDRMVESGRERTVATVLDRAGVPGAARDQLALVCEADGRVAGVAGVAAADQPAVARRQVHLRPIASAATTPSSEEKGLTP